MKTKSVHHLALLSAAILAAGALVSITPAYAGSSLTSKDSTFAINASEAGATEIQESELAREKSSNADVKSLADMMIEDHKKAAAELDKIVTSKGGEPTKSPGMSQKASILLLKTHSGDAFDKAFAENMVSDHKEAVALFEKAAAESDDADVKKFAEKTLPTLKHHLEMSEKLADKLGK